MTPGDRTHRNALLRLSDLTVNNDLIEDQIFENCKLVGPAVIVPMDSEFSNCGWLGEPDALIWEIPEERTLILGAIGLVRCRFYGCTFERIGMGLRGDAAEQFRRQIQHP
jgi:hypothetical protein